MEGTPTMGTCLTGTMMDVQSWVDHNGRLRPQAQSKTEKWAKFNLQESIPQTTVQVINSTLRIEGCKMKNDSDGGYLWPEPKVRAINKRSVVLFITARAATTVDVSETSNPVSTLAAQLQTVTRTSNTTVTILSMARCGLREVPDVFSLKDNNLNSLGDTIEYMTLYGNQFDDHQSTADRYESFINATDARTLTNGIGYDARAPASWPRGFKGVRFKKLKELDLRASAITTLSEGIFTGMETLQAVYLSENSILKICAKAFAGLENLVHLDLSKNYDYDQFGNYKSLVLDSVDVMADLKNLVSLDFSYTRLSQSNVMMFKHFGKAFQRLSLCETGLTNLRENFFAKTSLRYLDISGNNGILKQFGALAGLEKTLEVLYAVKIGLTSLTMFERFERLEILNVQQNEIAMFTHEETKTLKNLQILDLDYNRMTTWFDARFSLMPRLKYLSLRRNNVNMINEMMIKDFRNLKYLGFSENYVMCNCYTRGLFETALIAEQENINSIVLKTTYENDDIDNRFSSFHTGFITYNAIINKMPNITEECERDYTCDSEIYNNETIGSFRLIDYDPFLYQCMEMSEGIHVSYTKMFSCNSLPRDLDLGDVFNDSKIKLIISLVVTLAIIFPLLVFMYVYRRNFRYFCITVKNSALLSMINNDAIIDDSRIFNYDVFVSYCNDDRGWILDQLLPHLETDCGVSVCLHERDFQVGLSILENIVSCMDRSRSIMLIISREFLLSQWCQFEMHLAQHRLLETRREDLILVLLEEIPRSLRPTTLHYLMLTKTYIVYPSDAGESSKKEFWRRLGRSVAARRPDNENDSLA